MKKKTIQIKRTYIMREMSMDLLSNLNFNYIHIYFTLKELHMLSLD